eukprot:10187604-Alexandrium_andersonii.AAC.1
MRCHPDRLRAGRFPNWSKTEHDALAGMAKEVYDFASACLDCSNYGSVGDDVIEDYGFRVRA